MISTLTTLVFAAGAWAGTVFFAADGDERRPEPRREPAVREEARRDEPRREEPRPDGDRRPMPFGRGPGFGGGPRPSFDPERMKEMHERMEHFRKEMEARGGEGRPPFDPEKMKEFRERMEKFHREMAAHGGPNPAGGRPETSRDEIGRRPPEPRRPQPRPEEARCPECEKLAARRHADHPQHHARRPGPPQPGDMHAQHHRPDGHPGPHGLEEISRKLDRLTAAVEELTRSLKR